MLKQKIRDLGTSEQDLRHFGVLLSPSWSSSLVCILLGMTFAAGIIVSANFADSSLEQQLHILRGLNNPNDPSFTVGTAGFTFDNVLGAIVTFSFWLAAGVALYLTVAGIIRGAMHARHFRNQLDYVNIERTSLIRTTIIRLGLRLATLAGLFFYLRFFYHTVAVNALYWLYAAAHSFAFDSACRVALAVLVVAVALHGLMILLRLLALRPRLFGVVHATR